VGDKINKFDNHEVILQKGDIVYIFSDGYADQIGGQESDKFMYARFRELLLKIKDEPMAEQQRVLDENFASWKGHHEQLDDILIIGFRV
jgi:serine phosphatase RsbU (regulator of sigma subunit)